MLCWIAIYTKPRQEKKTARELGKKGIEAYLPLLKERRKWSDRKKWVKFPLFRSYVFARIELKNTLFVSQTAGVAKIVRLGRNIAVIRNDVINSIKLMIDGEFHLQATDYFLTGDKVQVKAGPLKGIVGEVIQVNNKDRLVIRVNAIQHSISVKINRVYLSPIK